MRTYLGRIYSNCFFLNCVIHYKPHLEDQLIIWSHCWTETLEFVYFLVFWIFWSTIPTALYLFLCHLGLPYYPTVPSGILIINTYPSWWSNMGICHNNTLLDHPGCNIKPSWRSFPLEYQWDSWVWEEALRRNVLGQFIFLLWPICYVIHIHPKETFVTLYMVLMRC